MTEAEIQEQLQSLLDQGTSGAGDAMGQVVEPLIPLFTLFFIVSIVLTVVVTIAFIISAIQKHRTHKAILRIDENLQKLVDAQNTTASSKNS